MPCAIHRTLQPSALPVSPLTRARRAVGTLLLRAVAAEAKRCDCARLQWQALSWNKKAVDFYVSDLVGARERVGDDGTKWLNFIMDRASIARLANPMAS